MKLLTLVRHNQAEKKKSEAYDFERMLTKQGQRDAKLMAKSLFKEPGFTPNLVLSSMAFRAIGTARILAKKAGFKKGQIQSHEKLYSELGWDELRQILNGLPDDLQHVVIVGHNPWLENVVNQLFPGFVFSLPKGSSIHLRFDAMEWKHVSKENVVFHFLKFLGDSDDLPKLNKFYAKGIIGKLADEVGTVLEKGSKMILGEKDKGFVKTTKKMVKRHFFSKGIVTVRSLQELNEVAEAMHKWEEQQDAEKLEKKRKKEEKKAAQKAKKAQKKAIEKERKALKKEKKKNRKSDSSLKKHKKSKVKIPDREEHEVGLV